MDKQLKLLIEELQIEGVLTTAVANKIIKKLTEATEAPTGQLVDSYKFQKGDKVYYFHKNEGALCNATFCLCEGNLAWVLPVGTKEIELVDLVNIYPGYYPGYYP
jgi:hypothetical protein